MNVKFLLFFLCYSLTCNADVLWQHSIINYTRHQYKAANQNWMVEQHPNGWMYFANNKGLLEFDGVEWNTYPIHNAKTRAVKAGSNGKIYVGGLGQFGYFTPNKLGRLDYICLSQKIDKRSVGNIWNILIADECVYFQSDRSVFCLEKDKLTRVDCTEDIMCSAILYNKFYIATSNGLYLLSGKIFQPLPRTKEISRSKIVGLLPFENKILVVSSQHGMYLYDGKTVSAYHSDADSFLKENQLFCSAIQDSMLALGSVQNGVLLLNIRRNIAEKISIDNGLQNKTILSLSFDRNKNLWLGLDNGIDYVRLDSPLYFMLSKNTAIGAGYSTCRFKGKLYLGTNQGLYVANNSNLRSPNTTVSFVSGTRGQVWSLTEYDNTLFCGGGNALTAINSAQGSYQVEGIRGVWSIKPFNTSPNTLLAGSYGGLYLLHKEGGRWQVAHKIEDGSYSAKTMYIEDGSDAVWVANKESGLYRLTLSNDFKKVDKSKNYNSQSLPAGDNVYITKIDNEIVVASRQGLFRYNQMKDSLEAFSELENKLDGKVAYTYLMQDVEHNLWYVSNGRVKMLPFDKFTQTYQNTKVGSYLKDYLIEDFEHIGIYDKYAVIGTEEGFCLLDYEMERQENRDFDLNPQIRKVFMTGKRDSLVYGWSFTKPLNGLVLNYKDNSLRFECSANNYDRLSQTLYSFRLVGVDHSWTQYTSSPIKEYTDLKEGIYTFEVQATTDLMKKSVKASLTFEVLPPWYRSWWAYLLYGILTTCGLIIIYYYITKKQKKVIREKNKELIKQKIEFAIESEIKDRTIDSLKEEQLKAELRHNSEELIQSALNIVRKNEMLEEIRKEAINISHSINEENLVSIRRKTLRLINRIDTNIGHDNDLQSFQNAFDRTHYNFFKRLEYIYPDLNNKEKILCAYIRMNLMSKEIAPLLNMSLRSVEISRYRLRKKMKLEEKDNLADVLRKIENNEN